MYRAPVNLAILVLAVLFLASPCPLGIAGVGGGPGMGPVSVAGKGGEWKSGPAEWQAKGDLHVGTNPGRADGRDGGENIADAFVISGLPFYDTGNTCDNLHDLDEACPFSGSEAPDVVYVYTATFDGLAYIDLCGSSYDTKLYVYEEEYTPGEPVACNDDYYTGDPCGLHVSFISVPLYSGRNYFIVVDGFGNDCGDYNLQMSPYQACVFCPPGGVPESEPSLEDEYVDNYNGGCNSDPPVFFELDAIDALDCMTVCGTSGWYAFGGEGFRDTDWYEAVTIGTQIEWTLDAEYPIQMLVLNDDCEEIQVMYSGVAGPCSPATLNFPTQPNQRLWLWVGPTVFAGPVTEFPYVMTICGLSSIPNQVSSWGTVKIQYR